MKTENQSAKSRTDKASALLRLTLFATRPKVGEWQLYPLTGGRMAVLEEKGNVLARGAQEGQDVDAFTVYEALYVAVLTGDDLAEQSLMHPREWKREVRSWAMDVPDDVLNDFWNIFNAELEAARAAETKPRKKTPPRTLPKG